MLLMHWFVTLWESIRTFVLRKPGGFQWSALLCGDLELSYAYVNFSPLVNSVNWWQATFECFRWIFIVRKMTERLEKRTWFRFFGDISWYQESEEPGEPQESGFSQLYNLPGASMPYSQRLANNPYPEPSQFSSSYWHYFLKIHPNIFLPSYVDLSKGLFPVDLPHESLKPLLSSSIMAT